MEKQLQRIALIVNPVSGTGSAKSAVASMVATLKPHFESVQVYVSDNALTGLENAVNAAIAEGAELLIACGGDGTLSQVVHHLYMKGLEQKYVVAFVPFGTCSDVAASLPVERHWEAALAHIIHQQRITIDVWIADVENQKGGSVRRHFVNTAGVGFTAACVARALKMPRMIQGMNRYLASAGVELPFWKNPLLEIAYGQPEQRFKGAAFNISVCNGRQNGGGVTWAPEASMTDGWLNVHLIGDLSRWGVLRPLAIIQKTGRVPPLQQMKEFLARDVTVTSIRPLAVECDGEVVGYTPLKITKAAHGLQVVTRPS